MKLCTFVGGNRDDFFVVDVNSSEHNGITKVSNVIYNDSLERLEKMIELGFKEGFTMTLNELENLLNHMEN